jgi:hypothetical protein
MAVAADIVNIRQGYLSGPRLLALYSDSTHSVASSNVMAQEALAVSDVHSLVPERCGSISTHRSTMTRHLSRSARSS